MPAGFYEVLEVSQTATQQQIKQAYKKLALKYHPDKNTDKQSSTIKFREISEAYSVLNDPKKRDNYDKYGTADLDFEEMGFEDFMGDFGAFEDFLEEFLSFNDFEDMFKEMNKKSKKKGKGRGRGKGRGKGSRNDLLHNMGKMGGKAGMADMAQMLGAMGMGGEGMEQALLEALLQGGDIDINDLMDGFDEEAMEKELQKMMFGGDDEEEDEEDLTQQQLKILQFGEKNVTHKKVGGKKKKKEIRCNFDNQKIKKEQILIHFSEKHMKQFKEREAVEKDTGSENKKSQQKGQKVEEEEQIQY